MKFGHKFGGVLPQKFGSQKTSKFQRDFTQLHDLIVNISRTQQDTNGQSENTVANYEHSRTGKLNFVYFDTQMAKNRTSVYTDPKSTFSNANISGIIININITVILLLLLMIIVILLFTFYSRNDNHSTDSNAETGRSQVK